MKMITILQTGKDHDPQFLPEYAGLNVAYKPSKDQEPQSDTASRLAAGRKYAADKKRAAGVGQQTGFSPDLNGNNYSGFRRRLADTAKPWHRRLPAMERQKS